jgi:hypothetical protein
MPPKKKKFNLAVPLMQGPFPVKRPKVKTVVAKTNQSQKKPTKKVKKTKKV